jgi:hypothetical protein
VALVLADEDGVKESTTAKSEFNVVVNTDGQVDKIKAESLEKAIEAIKEKVKTLIKENDGSGKSDARVKALKQALGELEKAKAKVLVLKVDGGKQGAKKEERRIVIRQIQDAKDAKVSAEQKAKIEKAKARIDGLRKELDAKRKELAEAQKDLAKLHGALSYSISTVAKPYVVREDIKGPVIERHIVRQKEVTKPATPHAAAGEHAQELLLKLRKFEEDAKHSAEDRAKSQSDSERLSRLEKKLAELLEQVSSLKKEAK